MTLKTSNAFTSDDMRFEAAQRIRMKVFVEEQQVPEELEMDEIDERANHYLALLNGEPVGTARSFDDDGWFHIGRLAVLAEARGQGAGGELLKKLLSDAKASGYKRAILNAQTAKCGFYKTFGFAATGEEFMEAGIAHFRMEAILETNDKS